MPRAHLVAAQAEVPLSVTAVSSRLGVSASTLRTWERRYGLGPGARRAGTHRRYFPEDVARLTRMVELTRSGVTAADAAATVLADDLPFEPTGEREDPEGPEDLVAAARQASGERLQRLIEVAVSTEGLVRTWTDLIDPALEAIYGSPEGEDPGHAPSSVIAAATLAVLRAVSDQCPPPAGGVQGPGVVVLTDHDHTLAAHVVGVAMQWNGLPTAVIVTGRHAGLGGLERFRAHRTSRRVSIAVVMGRGARCEHLITAIAQEGDIDVVVVGADTPTVLDARVLRVRTMSACVDETLALARSGAEAVDLEDLPPE